MLIKNVILAGIANGEIDLAFRRWSRPTVKPGSRLKTAIGEVQIDSIKEIDESRITAREAARAGFASREALLKEINCGRPGVVYRIALHRAGEDPRIALRENDTPDTRELAVEAEPMLPAVQLAAKLGYEKDWLKLNVRKLKNLGLTISHHPGYEISPRGRVVLRALRAPASSLP